MHQAHQLHSSDETGVPGEALPEGLDSGLGVAFVDEEWPHGEMANCFVQGGRFSWSGDFLVSGHAACHPAVDEMVWTYWVRSRCFIRQAWTSATPFPPGHSLNEMSLPGVSAVQLRSRTTPPGP